VWGKPGSVLFNRFYDRGRTCRRIESTCLFEKAFRPTHMPIFKKVIMANIALAGLSIGFALVTHAETEYVSWNRPEILSGFHRSNQKEGKKDRFLKFLTDVNVSIGAAGVSGGDYAARTTREVKFDALRVGRWFAHFGIRETSLFDPSPSQLDHELEYLGIGYETGNGRIRLFWDHICHNPTRKLPEEETNGIHWNEVGIGYETTGMRLGHKNAGVSFDSGSEWLNRVSWRASLSRIWMRTENDYEWMLKFAIRDDLFRMSSQVFFIRFDLDAIYDDRGISLNPCLEIGDRIRLNGNKYLIPFVSYQHFHDWYRIGEGEDFFSVGLSLEMGLGHENRGDISNSGKPKLSWSPRFHIDGGYAKIVDNEDYGYSSDFALDVDVLKLDQNKTFSLNTYAGILTLPDDLNPYVIVYRIGPSFKIDLCDFAIRILHSYSCLYGLEDSSVIRDYNLIALELRNSNVSHWNWNVKSGVYPSTKNFNFWGDLQGDLGFHFFPKHITPYVYASGHYLQGNSSVFGHALEAGVRVPGRIGSFHAYLRVQDDYDVFRFGRGRQKLLGVRFRF